MFRTVMRLDYRTCLYVRMVRNLTLKWLHMYITSTSDIMKSLQRGAGSLESIQSLLTELEKP